MSAARATATTQTAASLQNSAGRSSSPAFHGAPWEPSSRQLKKEARERKPKRAKSGSLRAEIQATLSTWMGCRANSSAAQNPIRSSPVRRVAKRQAAREARMWKAIERKWKCHGSPPPQA